MEGFFDQVEKFMAFYRRDEQETCRQARAHLKNTALSYLKRVPFTPRPWEELKTLLLKRLQPWDLINTYKAQFSLQCRRSSEEICSNGEALQRLADTVRAFMDHYTKEDMVVDQFLQGMDSD